MTRRSSPAVLASFLVVLLVTINASPVRGAEVCDGQSDNRCPLTSVVGDTDRAATDPAQMVHILGANGIGQEHFEAIEDQPGALFIIALPTAVDFRVERDGAPDNDQQMLPRQVSN
jgi:hypothetical protein